MRRIEGANAVEIATGKLGFRGRNSAAGLPGTAVTEQWLNDVQEELLGAIEGAGLAPAARRSQLLEAIRALGEPYAVDTGTENALVVDLATPGWTLTAGRTIRVRVAATSTYDTTIQVSNGGSLIGTYAVQRMGGAALCHRDLIAGSIARLVFDGLAFKLTWPTEMPVGMEMTSHRTGVIAGWVRKNGRTIGSATSGATELADSSARRLFDLLWSDTNLAVAGGRGANAAADWAAGKTLALPDARGRVQAGLDDMGAPAAGRLTATYFGQNGTVLGAAGGLQSAALATANLPPISYTPAGSVSVSLAQTPHAHGITDPGHNHPVNDPGHAHTVSIKAQSPLAVAGGAGAAANHTATSTVTTDPATTGIWLSPAGTGIGVQGANANISVSSATFAGQTVQLGGSSQAFSTVQPTITVGIYIRL
ncbi:hypothetical protein GJ689_24465 [Rhodoplanes serenus]|uniref:Phage tail protein n=1 Tax=Rhodoplanes serenus TaxID=200615 RepID=A0A9X4XQC1_9BRAD|nr:hypothetical protein [Rhodoplanes serenus]MTW19350.1 hypothetical protein [Rhodoplanes serenus]